MAVVPGAHRTVRYAAPMLRGLVSTVLFSFALTVLAGLALATACGGTMGLGEELGGSGGTPPLETGGYGTGGNPRRDGSVPVDAADADADALVDADAVVDGDTDVSVDVSSDYVAPECPDAPPPPLDEECELFVKDSCPTGLACFPFVEYPAPGDDCAQERYGTQCRIAGSRLQGEPCGGGDCAAGHICVLTGEGTICVQLCATDGSGTCPPGLLCEAVDIQPGVGGCY